MTCAKPPLESSRGLFKASFELKYEVFVVFSRTSSISILLYCCLLAPKCSPIGFYSSKEISIVALFVSLTASIFLLSTSFRILFFSWSFSFSCSSISPLSSDFSEFYPRASKCFPHALQLLLKICTQATQPRYMMKPNVHVTF